MREITLTLSPQELDQVCNALAQRPWVEVNNLLQKIVEQANTPPPVPSPSGEALIDQPVENRDGGRG